MKRRRLLSHATGWGALWALVPFFFNSVWRLQAQTSAGEILINRDPFVTVPWWHDQYLLGHELEPFSSPPIFAYDVNGSKVFETRLSIAGALEVYIYSMAASRDGGRFAASGLAVNLNTRTPFIAFLDRTGQVTRLIRPDHFYGQHVCFTRDGNLWVAGRAVPFGPEPEYDILRVYAPDGTLKASYLPRTSFAPGSPDRAVYPTPSVDGGVLWRQLAANDNLVVFLTVGYRQMVGLSLDGRVLFRTKVDLQDRRGSVTGLAVAPDGRVYLSSQEPVPGDPRTVATVFDRFDPASGQWSTIYRRATRERGLPRGVSMFDHERMLVELQAGRYAWVEPSGGSYALGK